MSSLVTNLLKVVVISTWLLLITTVAINLSLPTITNFLATHVPLTCLKPPYIFLLLNAIILTIAASSKFQHPTTPPPPHFTHPHPLVEEDSPVPAVVDVKAVVVNDVGAQAPTLDEVWRGITEKQASVAIMKKTPRITATVRKEAAVVEVNEEELNRRVEAFIGKLKEEKRLIKKHNRSLYS